MTRKKKSRKVGQIGIRKQEARPEKSTPVRKKKSPKGQKSGNRNSLLIESNNNTTVSSDGSIKKDKRIGSKKAISLTVEKKATQEKPIQHSNNKPEVKLTKVNPNTLSPKQELEAIENDPVLIDLVDRVDQGELLTGKEAKYFNKNMDRHGELLDLLGIEQEKYEDDNDDPLNALDADQWDDLMDDK